MTNDRSKRGQRMNVRHWRMTVRDSTTVRLVLSGSERLRTAVSTATITDVARELRKRLGDAGEVAGGAFRSSAFSRATRWFGHAARESWLYRWLTAKPESDVVVIDLRETWTVGPMLTILDRFLTPLVRYGRYARTRTAGVRLANAFATRPIQAVSTVVFLALVVNITLAFALGTPSRTTVGVGLLLAAVTLVGTRVTASADELGETRTFELLVALLEPPEPPDTAEENSPQSEGSEDETEP